MRIDRFLCKRTGESRSQVLEWLTGGQVRVDGRLIRQPSYRPARFQAVSVGGEVLQEKRAHYLMLHKPPGYLSATSDPRHPTVMELIDPALRPLLHIGGRLDRASSGLLILTNDGQWSRQLTDPAARHPKIYRVDTAYPICPDTPDRFARGIHLQPENLTTTPAPIELLSPSSVRLTIFEGRYHQIKRMFAAVGNRVVGLHRESMGGIHLDPSLAAGESRPLTRQEIEAIRPGQPATL